MTYKCKFCKKEFVRETTLVSHLCEQKRRIAAKDDKQNRIAYLSWLTFRKTTIANTKKDKPYEDFATSRYYTDFMKLSKYMIELKLDCDDFIKFLLKHSVKMSDWTKNFVYEEYVREKLKKETVERAVERSILHMKEWAEKTGGSWEEYFAKVPPAQAVHDFKTGRLSPWCTFATDQGSRLIDRLEPGQITDLIEFLDAKPWRARVKRQAADAAWVQLVFNKAGIL